VSVRAAALLAPVVAPLLVPAVILVVAPLVIPRATGSPVNPIAIL
jgi:hypothetical protein